MWFISQFKKKSLLGHGKAEWRKQCLSLKGAGADEAGLSQMQPSFLPHSWARAAVSRPPGGREEGRGPEEPVNKAPRTALPSLDQQKALGSAEARQA